MLRDPDELGKTTEIPLLMTEMLFEFRYLGPMVRVAAIDPKTNTEVIIVGAATTNDETLKHIAARKLRLALTRNTAGRR